MGRPVWVGDRGTAGAFGRDPSGSPCDARPAAAIWPRRNRHASGFTAAMLAGREPRGEFLTGAGSPPDDHKKWAPKNLGPCLAAGCDSAVAAFWEVRGIGGPSGALPALLAHWLLALQLAPCREVPGLGYQLGRRPPCFRATCSRRSLGPPGEGALPVQDAGEASDPRGL